MRMALGERMVKQYCALLVLATALGATAHAGYLDENPDEVFAPVRGSS